MKNENATKQDLLNTELILRQEMSDMGKDLRQEMSDMGKDLRQEMSDMRTELSSKIDSNFTATEMMFEKFTAIILEAMDKSVEKVKIETHKNTQALMEVERDRYTVLFEIHNDHETKIKDLTKSVVVLDERVLSLEKA